MHVLISEKRLMTNSLFSVEDKVVLITGGAGVLGGSIAQHLLSEGAKNCNS